MYLFCSTVCNADCTCSVAQFVMQTLPVRVGEIFGADGDGVTGKGGIATGSAA